MPKKYFKIELPDGSQIHVFFETASGIIVNLYWEIQEMVEKIRKSQEEEIIQVLKREGFKEVNINIFCKFSPFRNSQAEF